MSVLSPDMTTAFAWMLSAGPRTTHAVRPGRRRRQLWTEGAVRGAGSSRRCLEHRDNPERRYDPLAAHEVTARQTGQRG